MGFLARRVAHPGPAPRLTLRAAARGWAVALAAVCGLGLVAGIPSGLVLDALEPAVGVALLAAAAREFFRHRRP